MKNKCIAIAFLIVILSSCTNKADINNVKDLANNTTIYESTSLQENKQNQEIILEDVKGTSESKLNEQNSDSPVDNLKSSETIYLKEITSEENNDTKFIEKVRPIYNKDIVKLSDENFKKLIENKFVLDVDDINKYKEYFEIYKKNKNDKFPNFITVDSLLHTYNVYLWNLKTKIETKKLYALFTNFSENILKTVNDYYDRLKDTEMEKDIKAIKVYFTVPLKIANKEYKVDNDIAYMVEEEIYAIDNYRDERIIRPIFNEFASEYNENVDTQDKYKSSKLRYEKIKPYYDNYKIYKVANDCGEETNLREYYKILLWYRQIEFILEDEHLTKMALLMSYALKDSGLIEEYNRIDYVINYFLSSSHFGPNEYINAISEIYGSNVLDVNQILDKSNFDRFVNRSKEMLIEYENNIQKISEKTKYNVNFRFIGIPHTYDEEIFDYMWHGDLEDNFNFVDVKDIAAIFGSEVISDEMIEEYKYWSEFKTRLKALERIVPTFVDNYKNETIFSKYMKVLKILVDDEAKDYSTDLIKNSVEWTKKQLDAFCGSYTELKHDINVLLRQKIVTQSKKEILKSANDEQASKFDSKGYVDPEVAVYNELYNFINDVISNLDGVDMLDDNDKYKFNIFSNLLSQLIVISNKELNKEELSEAEYDLITNYGDTIEELIVDEDDYFYDAYGGSKYGTAMSVNIISGKDLNMEEKKIKATIGDPVELYVLVDVASEYKICRGAAYSFN